MLHRAASTRSARNGSRAGTKQSTKISPRLRGERSRQKKRPGNRGAFAVCRTWSELATRSGGDLLLVLNHRRAGLAGADRNAAGLLGLGDLADEIDMEQAVLERGVLHLHEIGELEHALEGARGDAAIQHFGLVLAVLIGGFLALDRQGVFLGDDGELALCEAGNR